MAQDEAPRAPLPWEPHKHQTASPDEDGDTCCALCGLVLDGPALAEAREIARLLGGT